MSKVCSKCKVDKEDNEFVKNNRMKCGLSSRCKECQNEANKISYNKNIEKRKEYSKKYRENNKEYFNSYNREYSKKNNIYKNRYHNLTIEEKEKKREYGREYYRKNKDKILEKNIEWYKKRKKEDPLFRLKCNIRSMIGNQFTKIGNKKNSTTEYILGCSFEEFKLYIESKFQPWMNWENKGLYNGELHYGWDIDHIIPLSEAKTFDDIIKLNHYTNLQPLCSLLNRDIKRSNNI